MVFKGSRKLKGWVEGECSLCHCARLSQMYDCVRPFREVEWNLCEIKPGVLNLALIMGNNIKNQATPDTNYHQFQENVEVIIV